MVIWFRVLDISGMEFIGSFSPAGTEKLVMTNYDSIFQQKKIKANEYVLTLKSFKRSDSGIYSCNTLSGGNKLIFGKVTRLVGGEFLFSNCGPKHMILFKGITSHGTLTSFI